MYFPRDTGVRPKAAAASRSRLEKSPSGPTTMERRFSTPTGSGAVPSISVTPIMPGPAKSFRNRSRDGAVSNTGKRRRPHCLHVSIAAFDQRSCTATGFCECSACQKQTRDTPVSTARRMTSSRAFSWCRPPKASVSATGGGGQAARSRTSTYTSCFPETERSPRISSPCPLITDTRSPCLRRATRKAWCASSEGSRTAPDSPGAKGA